MEQQQQQQEEEEEAVLASAVSDDEDGDDGTGTGIHIGLQVALNRFSQQQTKTTSSTASSSSTSSTSVLEIRGAHFNRATMVGLTSFLLLGNSSSSSNNSNSNSNNIAACRPVHPVQQLVLIKCSFDQDALLLFQRFLGTTNTTNNNANSSLKMLCLDTLESSNSHRRKRIVYSNILTGLVNNRTIRELVLKDDERLTLEDDVHAANAAAFAAAAAANAADPAAANAADPAANAAADPAANAAANANAPPLAPSWLGTILGNLLQHNPTLLTKFALHNINVNVNCIRAMHNGLIASRNTLQSLTLQHAGMASEELHELRRVYTSTTTRPQLGEGQQQDTTTTTNTTAVLTHVNISHNRLHRASGANALGQFLATLPNLQHVDFSHNGLDLDVYNRLDLNIDGARALFLQAAAAVGHSPVGSIRSSSILTGRNITTLNMSRCEIGNTGLEQLAAGCIIMPVSSSEAGAGSAAAAAGTGASSSYSYSPLVHLDLSYNFIRGLFGGQFLATVISHCRRLQSLDISNNSFLGANGMQAMAPSLAYLQHLQKFCVQGCGIAAAAHDVLLHLSSAAAAAAAAAGASSGHGGPRLVHLNLSDNRIFSYTTLSHWTDFLTAPGGGGANLQTLLLNGNNSLLGVSYRDYQIPFFQALGQHKHVEHLDVADCTMDDQTANLLVTACCQNTSLLVVNHTCHHLRRRRRRHNNNDASGDDDDSEYDDTAAIIISECTRRNKLQSNIKSSHILQTSPGSIPLAVWPVALSICVPRVVHQQTAIPMLIYDLVRHKMVPTAIFTHAAAVYRFEKIRACKQIQAWWRRQRRQHVQQAQRLLLQVSGNDSDNDDDMSVD